MAKSTENKELTVAEVTLNEEIKSLDRQTDEYLEFRDDAIETLRSVYWPLAKYVYQSQRCDVDCDDDLEATQTLAVLSLALDKMYQEYISDMETTVSKLRKQVDNHYLKHGERS